MEKGFGSFQGPPSPLLGPFFGPPFSSSLGSPSLGTLSLPSRGPSLGPFPLFYGALFGNPLPSHPSPLLPLLAPPFLLYPVGFVQFCLVGQLLSLGRFLGFLQGLAWSYGLVKTYPHAWSGMSSADRADESLGLPRTGFGSYLMSQRDQ